MPVQIGVHYGITVALGHEQRIADLTNRAVTTKAVGDPIRVGMHVVGCIGDGNAHY